MTSLTEFKLSEPPGSDGQNEALRRLGTSARWLGRPEKLVQLVDKAVVNFLAVAQEIAEENPEFQVRERVDCRKGGQQPHPLLITGCCSNCINQ